MTTITETMWTKMSGHDQKRQQLARLDAIRTELFASIPVAGTAERTLSDKILAASTGKPVNVHEAIDAFVHSTGRSNAVTIAIAEVNTAIRDIRDTLDSFTETEQQAALDYLRTTLTKTLDEIAALDSTLGPVDSAEAAIRANTGKEWTRLIELADQYGEIRTAHAALIGTTTGHDDATITHWLRTAGVLRDAIRYDTYWTSRRWVAVRNSSTKYPAEEQWVQWLRSVSPSTEHGSTEYGLWPHDNHAAYVRWLATVATPWLPSATEAATAYDLASTAVRETIGQPNTAWLEQARTNYYALTGTTPLTIAEGTAA